MGKYKKTFFVVEVCAVDPEDKSFLYSDTFTKKKKPKRRKNEDSPLGVSRYKCKQGKKHEYLFVEVFSLFFSG